MKARVFIGSSVEGLDIAYAIQQNLEYDCNPTVWTQGIFNLSSSAIDDLIKALSDSDFGIFAFRPDDLLTIRNQSVQSVRDNVIFELGLFIGKLGKEKVFFVIPKNETNLHLPTDLLGVTPGIYDDKRDDNNLIAALGPFCNQIRIKLKDFLYQNLNDLKNETKEVKKIAIERPRYWEYLLAAELLEPKLEEINRSYAEIEKGLLVRQTVLLTELDEFKKFFESSLQDLMRLVEVFYLAFANELINSFGPPGISGNVLEIKLATDRIIAISKELLEWESRLQATIFPDKLREVKLYMSGWSKNIFLVINKIPPETRRVVNESLSNKSNVRPVDIDLKSAAPKNADKILQIFEEYSQSQN